MKTPEEIKKGLECCTGKPKCGECTYNDCENCSALPADALAHIQQLEAQIPKWISVEERLPDGPGEVLVVLHGCVVEAWYCGDGEFETGSGLVLRNDGVTHWMPLPEPPKEE